MGVEPSAFAVSKPRANVSQKTVCETTDKAFMGRGVAAPLGLCGTWSAACPRTAPDQGRNGAIQSPRRCPRQKCPAPCHSSCPRLEEVRGTCPVTRPNGNCRSATRHSRRGGGAEGYPFLPSTRQVIPPLTAIATVGLALETPSRRPVPYLAGQADLPDV